MRPLMLNGDAKACIVCGAERAFFWMFCDGEDGQREWCCKGKRSAGHVQWRKTKMALEWKASEQRRDSDRAQEQRDVSPPLSLQRGRRFPRAEVTPKATAADLDAAARSRTPRVSSRVRSCSPRESSMVAQRARARRFIHDEADADDDDAVDDEAGAENLDVFEKDGFVVSDHESESDESEAADADEGAERDDEMNDDESPRTPLGAAPRACSASRTEVVESEPRSRLAQEVTQGVTPGTEEVAQEVSQEVEQEVWPPCRLPPRLRESPPGIARRAIDFGITCTPQGHKATDRAPNPVQPSDAERLAAAYVVMRKAARLLRHMHARGILLEAAGGMERGDENGHPHAQIAGRAMSGRELKYWLEFMRIIFKFCCTEEHRVIYYYTSVVLRKKQSQEYALGYCMKQYDRDWQQNRPDDEGFFRIGALENESRVNECWDVYMAYAGDMANEQAYSKVGGGSRGGGTGGYNARRGGHKALDLNKSNFFSIAHDMIKNEKLNDAVARTSTAKQVALVLEGGKHQLTPSWALSSRGGHGKVDEAQIATLDYINMNPYLAADVSLVRHAMFGYHERPSELRIAPVFWRPSVLPALDVIESLSRVEAKAYSVDLSPPPHARLRERFPYVESPQVRGYAIVIDLMYSFSGSTSERVAVGIAERGYSITPNIFNDLGEQGLDCTGKYSCAHIALCQDDFARSPLDDIGRFYCYAVRTVEYDLWVERVLAVDPSIELTQAVLTAYRVPLGLHHGIMSAEEFLGKFDEITAARAHDGFSHTVIIRDEEALVDTSPTTARMRPREHMHDDHATDADVPVAPTMSDAPLQPGSLVDIDDLSALLAEDEPEIVGPDSRPMDAQIPMPEQLPRGGDPDGIARSHHYMVCWRPGSHPMQGDIHRYDNLDEERGGGQAAWGVEGEVVSFRHGDGRPVPLGRDMQPLPPRARSPSRTAASRSPRARVSPNRSRSSRRPQRPFARFSVPPYSDDDEYEERDM